MTFDEFERRVRNESDLEMGPFYWNWTLHEITGRALWYLFTWPVLRDLIRSF